MASLKELRAALASQIEAATGVDSRPYFPESITPPMIAVMPGQPYEKFGIVIGEKLGMLAQIPAPTEYSMTLIILVSRVDIEQAQQDVDALIDVVPQDNGMDSIPMAIARDDTLGDLAEYCTITQISNVGQTEVSGAFYFTARVQLSISAKNAFAD